MKIFEVNIEIIFKIILIVLFTTNIINLIFAYRNYNDTKKAMESNKKILIPYD